MELLQLKYFCHAAETENFAKTAREFLVPPASISQSIKRLENEVGASLFDRTPNGVGLNERGRILYLNAKSALSMLDDAKKKIRDEEIGGHVHLLVETNRNLVNEAVCTFRESYKNVSFLIDHTINGDVEKYDLIVTDNVPFRKNYNASRLITEPIRLALCKDHPLAKKARIPVSLLADERFITTQKESGLFAITRRICAKGQFAPSIAIETNEPSHVAQFIDQGLGIGFVPAVSWRDILLPNTVLREIEGVDEQLLTRPSLVIFNTKKYMSKATSTFLGALLTVAKSYQ